MGDDQLMRDRMREDSDEGRLLENECSIACSRSSGFLVRILLDDKKSYEEAKELLQNYLIDYRDLDVGECIGEGSSGIVYKGVFRGKIKVAIKELKGVRQTERLEFRREVLGLIKCVHKNVLELYGVCVNSQHDNKICIVTKFMEGGSLLHFLQTRRDPLKVSEILKLAKDVAQGMEFLHFRGIAHMDLKTANVFLDEDGDAVIGDLGVARLANEKMDGGGEIGTYRWMAPEVCAAMLDESNLSPTDGNMQGSSLVSAGTFSLKSDVYSFGILLWELVTCKLPYADYTPVQAAVGVVIHGLRPTIPDWCFPPLCYLIQKCWDRDPSVRPTFSHILQMLLIISHQNWN